MLAQVRVKWGSLVNTVIKLLVPYKAGNFLNRTETKFSESRLLKKLVNLEVTKSQNIGLTP
jgi:hypothetical protein